MGSKKLKKQVIDGIKAKFNPKGTPWWQKAMHLPKFQNDHPAQDIWEFQKKLMAHVCKGVGIPEELVMPKRLMIVLLDGPRRDEFYFVDTSHFPMVEGYKLESVNMAVACYRAT